MEFKYSEDAPRDVTLVRLTTATEVHCLARGQDHTVLEYGIGTEKVDQARFIQICRGIIGEARRLKLIAIAIDFSEFNLTDTVEDPGYVLGLEFVLANYRPRKAGASAPGYDGLKTLYVLNGDARHDRIADGIVVGIGCNECRELVDMPSNVLTPSHFLAKAIELANGSGAVVSGMLQAEIEHDLGLLYAVGKGSPNKPELIEVSYLGGDQGHKPIVFVGKGITLDEGGTDLKLSGAIQGMHKDMAGGAAAIMAVIIAARLKLRVNAVAIVPAAENVLSGGSYRTNDVISGLGGRTVLVLNTDAEGRLVLDDGVTYAVKHHDPSILITAATLTGAIIMSLANRYTGLFSADIAFVEELRRLGSASGNPLWHMPHEGYEKRLVCDVANIANVQPGGSKDGGACVAAAFVAEAVKATGFKDVFAHLDIAGTAMEGSGTDGLHKGAATGVPVPLLVKLLMAYAAKNG